MIDWAKPSNQHLAVLDYALEHWDDYEYGDEFSPPSAHCTGTRTRSTTAASSTGGCPAQRNRYRSRPAWHLILHLAASRFSRPAAHALDGEGPQGAFAAYRWKGSSCNNGYAVARLDKAQTGR